MLRKYTKCHGTKYKECTSARLGTIFVQNQGLLEIRAMFYLRHRTTEGGAREDDMEKRGCHPKQLFLAYFTSSAVCFPALTGCPIFVLTSKRMALLVSSHLTFWHSSKKWSKSHNMSHITERLHHACAQWQFCTKQVLCPLCIEHALFTAFLCTLNFVHARCKQWMFMLRQQKLMPARHNPYSLVSSYSIHNVFGFRDLYDSDNLSPPIPSNIFIAVNLEVSSNKVWSTLLNWPYNSYTAVFTLQKNSALHILLISWGSTPYKGQLMCSCYRI